MKRTTITLGEDEAYWLAREARRRHTSVSAVIRRLIAEQLPGHAGSGKPRDIPWIGMANKPDATPGSKADKVLEKDWPDAIRRHRG